MSEEKIPVSYKAFKIPKAGGGFRVIQAPHPKLKEAQTQIYKTLLGMGIGPGAYLHAYVKRRSIKTCALSLMSDGRTPQFLLKADIKDFFPSLTKDVVMRACKAIGIVPWLLEEIEKLCFIYDKKRKVWHLPQGSPASPILSNIVMRFVARRIAGLVRSMEADTHYTIRFSAYCDNLMFTADCRDVIRILFPLRRILASYGLELNRQKTKLISQPARQEVCGVVLSHKTSVRKDYWKLLRAKIFNALTDLKAGVVTPGTHIADPKKRTKYREKAGVAGKAGFKKGVVKYPKKLETEDIPWAEWKGQIAYVGMLNPDRGRQLTALMETLETETESCRSKTNANT